MIVKIRKLNLPIEICPKGHQLIGWWKTGTDHPIKNIYKDVNDPVVLGTDDSLLYQTSMIEEEKLFREIFDCRLLNLEEKKKFRFE